MNPLTGDVTKKFNEDAIIQSLKNLVLTYFGEKPFNPEFGTNVSGSLFEIMDEISAREMRTSIANVISGYEPRVDVRSLSVDFVMDQYAVEIVIVFRIKNLPDPVKINIILRRTR